MTQLLLVIALAILASSSVYASSSGQNRRTLPDGQGCGSCHGGSASSATTLSTQQAVGNKIFVTPGQNIRLDVIVANSSPRPATGINIGVKTTPTSETNVGTLATLDGFPSTRADFSGELTHSSPRTMSGGTATFTFQWTAPSTEGSVYLRATANAVNRNGSPDAGDQWNFMEPVEIVVGSVASVPHASHIVPAVISPLPATHSVAIEAQAEAGESFDVLITSAAGVTVFADRHTTSSDGIRFTWRGTTSSGVLVPNGTYLVMFTNERRSILGKAIIQR